MRLMGLVGLMCNLAEKAEIPMDRFIFPRVHGMCCHVSSAKILHCSKQTQHHLTCSMHMDPTLHMVKAKLQALPSVPQSVLFVFWCLQVARSKKKYVIRKCPLCKISLKKWRSILVSAYSVSFPFIPCFLIPFSIPSPHLFISWLCSIISIPFVVWLSSCLLILCSLCQSLLLTFKFTRLGTLQKAPVSRAIMNCWSTEKTKARLFMVFAADLADSMTSSYSWTGSRFSGGIRQPWVWEWFGADDHQIMLSL